MFFDQDSAQQQIARLYDDYLEAGQLYVCSCSVAPCNVAVWQTRPRLELVTTGDPRVHA